MIVATIAAHRQCMRSALRMLGRRDHGIQELREKLQCKGFSSTDVEASLTECIRLGYLNDEKFASALVLDCQRQGYGPQRIAQKLKSRGIADNLAAQALAEHFGHIRQVRACRKVLEKKMKTISYREDSLKNKARLFRFLYARGFSPDIIRQAMSIQTH